MRGAAAIGKGLADARAPRPIGRHEVIHVVGVAGAGASAGALLAAAAGAQVSGCDPGAPSPYSEAVVAHGIAVATTHDVRHVTSTEAGPPTRLAVTKAMTSVQPDHPELEAARSAGIPVEPWQQVVADAAASQGGRLVAVSGTHGKSTSAGWLVHVLEASGRDPAAFVGALLPGRLSGGSPATARWGSGDVFVVEADEYAGNFEPYRPSIAIVLNVDWDHPDVFVDRAAVVDAFEAWLLGPGAEARQVVIDIDDAGAAQLADRLRGHVGGLVPVTVRGKGPGVVSYALEGDRLHVLGLGGRKGPACRTGMRLAGRHNAANAACVAATAAMLGVSVPDIASGLGSFEGVGRRLEVKGEPGGVLVIDDYGHHPTAIRATIEAVRARYPGRPIWVAHEPLTYHRAAAMLEELALALADADHVVVADIWAGRDPDTTITSAVALASAVARLTGEQVAAPGSAEDTAGHLARVVGSGDIVLTMGGGRSYVIADRLVSLLAGQAAE